MAAFVAKDTNFFTGTPFLAVASGSAKTRFERH